MALWAAGAAVSVYAFGYGLDLLQDIRNSIVGDQLDRRAAEDKDKPRYSVPANLK